MTRKTLKIAVALVAFARSKEGRKLIHQFARSQGRKLLRNVKRHPGGKRLAKLVQSSG